MFVRPSVCSDINFIIATTCLFYVGAELGLSLYIMKVFEKSWT